MRCINEARMTERTWKETLTLFKFSSAKNAVKEQEALVRDIIKGLPNATEFKSVRNADEAIGQ